MFSHWSTFELASDRCPDSAPSSIAADHVLGLDFALLARHVNYCGFNACSTLD